jgi:hypothetical protein
MSETGAVVVQDEINVFVPGPAELILPSDLTVSIGTDGLAEMTARSPAVSIEAKSPSVEMVAS